MDTLLNVFLNFSLVLSIVIVFVFIAFSIYVGANKIIDTFKDDFLVESYLRKPVTYDLPTIPEYLKKDIDSKFYLQRKKEFRKWYQFLWWRRF